LAVALTGILKRIIETPPESLLITPEWLCSQHRDLAAGLFPQWAGRYRDREVQIGGHTPPPLYEVPVLVRLFCDDLAERLRHLGAGTLGGIADLLAWADWRFQWIHPFRDFNGRIGRVLLVALIHRTGLPPMDTVQTEPNARRQYLHALQAADNGDLGPLTDIWACRIAEML
jgi:Fic family protein